jgi:hypothetical protein
MHAEDFILYQRAEKLLCQGITKYEQDALSHSYKHSERLEKLRQKGALEDSDS